MMKGESGRMEMPGLQMGGQPLVYSPIETLAKMRYAFDPEEDEAEEEGASQMARQNILGAMERSADPSPEIMTLMRMRGFNA